MIRRVGGPKRLMGDKRGYLLGHFGPLFPGKLNKKLKEGNHSVCRLSDKTRE
jgi:hypothetical protein